MTQQPLVEFSLKRSCVPVKYVGMNEDQLFLLGSSDELGADVLNHAKPFKYDDETETYVFAVSLPANTTFEIRLFSGVRRGKTFHKELSLLSFERKPRQITVGEKVRQEIDLVTYGSLAESGGLIDNAPLIDDVAVCWNFSLAKGPVVALDFDDADQFSIEILRADNVNFVHMYTSESEKPHIRDESSFVSIQMRCFDYDKDDVKVVCGINDQEGTNLGLFELDFETISLYDSGKGRYRIPLTNGQGGRICADYIYVKPYAQKKEMKSTHLICDKTAAERVLPDASGHNFWLDAKSTLIGGNRGCGRSFAGTKPATVRENTLTSYQKAIENGVNFITCPVTLTRDKEPVITGEFGIKIDGRDTTVHMQHSTGLREACEASPSRCHPRTNSAGFNLDESWTMPLLRDLYHSKETSNAALHIEVKWPSKDINNNSLDDIPEDFIDMNRYCDAIIGDVVQNTELAYHDLMYSSASPDIVYFLKMKQCLFPVMLETGADGILQDSRLRRSKDSLRYAKDIDLLGTVQLAEQGNEKRIGDLVQVAKTSRMHVFCHGDYLTTAGVQDKFRKIGVSGLICDGIGQ